jgi:membrane protease YdiL (CAAX protease family)
MPKRAVHLAISRPMTVIVPMYVALIALAECIGAFIGALPAVIGHALLLLTLSIHYVIALQPSDQDYMNLNASYWFIEVLPILALLPLMRLLGHAMTPLSPEPIVSYVLVGLPLLLAVSLTARLIGRSPVDFGLVPRSWPSHLGMALAGVPLGLIAYLILRPQPITNHLDWIQVVIGAVILTTCAALSAEVIFRGMLQRIASEIFGRSGLLWSSILFAVMHIASLSAGYVIFAGVVGLIFGWHVNRTGSLWGVVLAHGLLLSGLMLVWPHLVR